MVEKNGKQYRGLEKIKDAIAPPLPVVTAPAAAVAAAPAVTK
jgi:hypothetical protein